MSERSERPFFSWGGIVGLLSLPLVFWSGMRCERSLTPDCVEKDVTSPFQVRIRIEALERTVEHLDETLAYERGRLDETRQRMQVHREDAIRCCTARPVR